jgi:hypothetical protein
MLAQTADDVLAKSATTTDAAVARALNECQRPWAHQDVIVSFASTAIDDFLGPAPTQRQFVQDWAEVLVSAFVTEGLRRYVLARHLSIFQLATDLTPC